MGAVKEAYLQADMMTVHRLMDLRAALMNADLLADQVRTRALRDHSSDEPYETAFSLSEKVASALTMVEIMLDDMGVRS